MSNEFKDISAAMIPVPTPELNVVSCKSTRQFLDTGFTRHMISQKEYFDELMPALGEIQVET